MVESLKSLMRGESLSRSHAAALMNQILQGQVRPEQIGALLIALQIKGESVEEIVGFVQALRAQAKTVDLRREDVIDSCGTGGDGASTFNVSTTVAFVTAAAGQAVAKHGNRAVSSRSGSFDVLENLGVVFASEPEQVESQIDRFGLSFMFAPTYHPAMKDLAPLRRSLGIRTVFNLLGPLLNPARVQRQLIGVFAPQLVEKVAEALLELGAKEAMVVHGEDGLDEISLSAPTRIAHVKDGQVKSYVLTPESCGLRSASLDEMRGGDARENAEILEKILAGEKSPRRDLVVLNSAAALVVGGKASDFKEGVALAARALDSGEALRRLRSMQDTAGVSQCRRTGT